MLNMIVNTVTRK